MPRIHNPPLVHTHTRLPFLAPSESKSFWLGVTLRMPDTYSRASATAAAAAAFASEPFPPSPPHPSNPTMPSHVPGQHEGLSCWPWRGFWGCWWVGRERRRGARHRRVSTWPRDPRRRGQCACTRPSNKAQPAVVFSHSREAC